MKKAVLFSTMGVLTAWAGAAGAEEIGRVISSTPVIAQVAVPRQVCGTQPGGYRPNSGAGAVMGGIAGGALGNTLSTSSGSGRAAATVLGLIGGAVIGNSIENSGRQVPNAQSCSTQTFHENRTVAYHVVYEYAGREYNVRMPYDPGPTIRLQVTPVAGDPASMGAPSQPGGVIVAPPVQAVAAAPMPERWTADGDRATGRAPSGHPPAMQRPYGYSPNGETPDGYPPIAQDRYRYTPNQQTPDGYPPDVTPLEGDPINARGAYYPSPPYPPAYPAYPAYPVYPAYYPSASYYPWFAPIGLSLGFGFSRSYGGRHFHNHGGQRHGGGGRGR